MKLFGYEITITKTNPVDAVPINTTIHVQPDKPWPRQTTFAIVQMLIHQNCGNHLGEIKPESTPDDLMLDSLDEVELMMAVEEWFGIDIEMTDWESCRNVDEVVKLVDKILMEKYMNIFGYEISIKRKPSSQESTPNKDDTYSRVEKVLLQGNYGWGSNIDFLTREVSFDEMCMDSLDKVEFLMHIESAFGIDILDEEFATCQTIGDVVDLVDEILEENSK